MNDVEQRIAELSSDKRDLLHQLALGQRNKEAICVVVPRPDIIPLTSGQKRLWLLEQLTPGMSAYNSPHAYWLEGSIDLSALQQAAQSLIDHFEILRTVFVNQAGYPVQRIRSSATIAIRCLNTTEPDTALACQQALQWANEDARQSFDLQQDLLLRVLLVSLGAEKHLLLLTFHHIAIDGWSMAILQQQFQSFYNSAITGAKSPSLPATAPMLQIADIALWQQKALSHDVLNKQLDYWQQTLQGANPTLDLPVDHVRPATQNFHGNVIVSVITESLHVQLESFAQSKQVSKAMVLLSVYQMLLARYSGQDDIVVGMGVAGRAHAELEEVVGFLVNTLPLRTRIADDQTFVETLAQVRQSMLAAMEQADVQLDTILERLRVPRNTSYTPFAQALFFYQSYPEHHLQMQGLRASKLCAPDIHTGSAQGDISLSVSDRTLAFEYNSAIFSADTIRRLSQHFLNLLAHALVAPQVPVRQLPMMTVAEQQQLQRWNATTNELPADCSIAALLQAQVLRTPDAQAVQFSGDQLSYRELDAHATAVARQLQAHAIGPGDLVPIYLDRSLEMLVGLHGIIKSGAAYVPLDPAYPQERLAYMLEMAQARVILAPENYSDALIESVATVLSVDLKQPPADSNGFVPRRKVAADDLAYVIFTSGSTGKPKGVEILQQGAVNLLQSVARAPGMRTGDVLCAISTLSFDIALFELVLPFTVGASIVLADRATAQDAGALHQLLTQHRFDVMQATPATWRMLLENGWQGQAGLKIISTGEALPAELAKRLLPCGCELWNLYGPTETTVYSALCQVTDADALIVVGKPIDNTEIHIVDRHGELTAPGLPGELMIGGIGLARGYLQRPDLTAEKFIQNRFSNNPQERLYRSGDLARWRQDGTIEVLGRIDHQVKIRGFRIELGEIESVLTHCQGVTQALVHCREDHPGDKRLVAYVLTDNATDITVSELRKVVAKELPAHMVPAAFVVLSEFPLTPNGKIDRKALPVPGQVAVASRRYEVPCNELEMRLAGIWQDLLHIEQVGRHDHFFELGGHSLLGTQLIARVNRSLGLTLPLRELFNHPVLADFAAVLANAETVDAQAWLKADRANPLPLSFAQQRLWFLDQLSDAASSAYHLPLALQLHGSLQIPALRAAFEHLLSRHESLRTRFISELGTPWQVIDPPGAVCIEQQDFSMLTDGDQQLALLAGYDKALTTPFDLSTGPLLRVYLWRLAEQQHVLLINQHHIISDGWSLNLLMSELALLYRALVQHDAVPMPDLPPPELQYADYAIWQQQLLQEDGQQDGLQVQQRRYWRQQLDGIPALLELPADRRRPDVPSYRGARVPVKFSTMLTDNLREMSRRHGCTMFMTVLAGWSALLYRLSGQQDIVIGTPVANRPRAELEAIPGFFVNMLALRIRFDDELGVAGLLNRIKTDTVLAFSHQDLPFEHVFDALQLTRSLSYSPVFQTTFTLNNGAAYGDAGTSGFAKAGLQVSSFSLPVRTAHFDLSLALQDDGFALTGELEYASDLFDEERVVQMTGLLETLMAAMVHEDAQAFDVRTQGLPQQEALAISRLPILTGVQWQQLMCELNSTEVAFPQDSTIAACFEVVLAKQGDAIALSDESQQLSYRVLNERANRIARFLLASGVQPDDRVAICMDRSVAMVVGLVGIVKAGAAYLPLDPACPPERLCYIADDAAPVAWIVPTASSQALPRERLQAVLTGPASGRPVLELDGAGLSQELSSFAGDNLDPALTGLCARHLAYVMYTSGSTGQPKGVMVEQRNVLRLVINNHFAAIGPHDCIAHCANPAFDASTWEIWGALLNGARVHVMTPAILFKPQSFNQALLDAGVSCLWLTAGLFNEYVEYLGDAFSRLNYLMVGGDVLDPSRIAMALRPGARPRHLLNGYGPTETTTFATTYEITGLPEHGSIPIGRPIANTQVYLLDKHLQPVPLGTTGELFIGGEGVARGYLNRPDLTTERFVVNPFSSKVQARLYRTGDLGRLRADGCIEFLGRNDFQVKIRGFRIELGEIEARLLSCENVREAVVLAREDRPGDKRLIAYLRLADGGELQSDQLRQHLLAQLPDYMVPSAFVALEKFPLTVNGKLDRKALPAPKACTVTGREYEALHGEVETTLAQIWQQLFQIERVGRHDHFFELGGHSLLAVRMVSQLRKRLGVEVTLSDVFRHPTLSALAELTVTANAGLMNAIEPVARGQALPVSLPQQRLWFLDQLEPAASKAYHLPAGWRLLGDLNKPALRSALSRLVARHESLRTTFVDTEGQPMQVIAPADRGFTLEEYDWRQRSPANQAVMLTEFGLTEAQTPFDLVQGPLFRGQLLQLADKEHVLLLNQHHIISDGWSIGVMLAELSTLYTSFAQGRLDPLPELSLQYADYAAWQRQWLQGERLQEQVRYWREHLSGAPALLTLPTDHPRPAAQSYAGDFVALGLSPELSAALHALAERNACTLFMVLLAAWSILLARLSGQSEVVIGTPVANRQRNESEPLIGFFVNTLALRVHVQDSLTIQDLLAQVKATALTGFSHQELPFEQVVEALQPERSLSHSPIFQSMLSLNNTTASGDLVLSGLHVTELNLAHTSAHFDVSLSLADRMGAISGELEFATDLFERSTIERMSGQYVRLLQGLVSDERRSIQHLGLLTETEREQLLRTFNATVVSYPQHLLIQQLFEARVLAEPDAIALVDGGLKLSYGELNVRANQVAHGLLQLGVKPESRVALCVERSAAMVVGLLGILKAGGVYVPLDPKYPAERLAYMLMDSAPLALLTQAGLQAHLPQLEAPVLLLSRTGELDTWPSELPTSNPDANQTGLNAGHLAYVIYTSGSTGQPKGVMVEHRQVTNFILAHCQLCELSREDRVLQFASISFDSSIAEIFPALASGACLVLRPDDLMMPDRRFARFLDQQAITVVDVPTAFWQQWSRVLAEQGDTAMPRLVIVSGEKAEHSCLLDWFAYPGNRNSRWFNNYGPTETTVNATSIAFDAQSDLSSGRLPIGRPTANVQIYILDKLGGLAAPGVTGELYIGGAGVARGYLNRPELTAERFVTNPFADMSGSRLYKTGDLGRWLPDGTIEYLGRNDFQVKIRGFRIELGEIETVLSHCSGVAQAVVLCREDIPGDKRLVAYVVAKPGAELSISALRATLTDALPSHMVPAAIVVMVQFPLTPNGKIDRKVLPMPGQIAVATRIYEAPVGDIEICLAELWQRLLQIEHVGRFDHFFELGGHSLLGTQVMARIRQQLGIEVALRELFIHPVLADFAAAVAASARADALTLTHADRQQILPLSFAQQRLWFLHQFSDAASSAYHLPLAMRLHGALNIGQLQSAFAHLQSRHESLRTRFVNQKGTAIQIIDDQLEPIIFEQDWSALSAAGQEQAFIAQCHQLLQTPFDLSSGPLWRVYVWRLSADQHILLINQHHIISDGWSINIVLNELAALYNAEVSGQQAVLPTMTYQYADYAVWQRQVLQANHGSALIEQRHYWQQQLAGISGLLDLPADRLRPEKASYRGGLVPLTLSAHMTNGLRQISHRHGCTMFMTLLAAWATLLYRLSEQTDIVIGTPVANRTRTELEPIVGFFVNMLALRLRFDHEPTLAALLEQVKATTVAAYSHQDLPFDEVVEGLHLPRSMSYSPVFQATFTLSSGAAYGETGFTGLQLTPLDVPIETAHFDLALSLHDHGESITGEIVYASDLFDRERVVQMRGLLETLWTGMVSEDELCFAAACQNTHEREATPVSRLPLLDHAQWQHVIHDLNRTAVNYPRDSSISQWFELQLQRYPDAIAVSDESQSLSYRELNARANRIAHYLRGLGVQADDRVAICLERSVAMVIGILGIIKAGAAYLPLDPAYPLERLRFIKDDATPVAWLIQASLRERLQELLESPVLELNDDGQHSLLLNYSAHNLEQALPEPRHLAYVIYTSGSTGQPKGVMVEHRNVLRLIVNNHFARIDRNDCVAHCANPAFDASTWEIWGALLNGARLHVVASPVLFKPKLFNQALLDAGVSCLWLTAGLFNEYVEHLSAACSQLKYLMVGGDVLDPSRIAMALRDGARPQHLLNGYGPTESTTFATTYEITGLSGHDAIPIGSPIANTQIYILDQHLQPVPMGMTGELFIGGDGVARGYLNRPDLTEEKFLPDPYSADPQARLYRTGDRGRWRADGCIDFLGRNDFQVKIRGFRIELGEIEARLLACDNVREALVIAREDRPGDKRLVAYVIVDEPANPETLHDGWRETLKAELPDYMMPSAFVVMERFPLNANGKVDRRALPDPLAIVCEETAAVIAEASVEEQRLALIWKELLNREQVGASDNFFALGGHSLLATRLLSRIEQIFGIEMPLSIVFESPSLAQMAQRIVETRSHWQQDNLEALLMQLEQLSDDEARAQLQATSG